MKFKKVLSAVILLALVGGLGVALTNAQAISDWLRLRNYDPPARIAKLADDTTMNDDTRRVFYANHPELGDKATFNTHCRTTEQSIVLGCYINNQGIFLLDVNDERLNGVIEVTAAHEVLHAAYDRLDGGEREKVDKMTADFFAGLKDKRIRETVENYRKNDPSVVPNELHSILGTEVRELSPELENYYSQYFNDRMRIVAFSEQYESTLTELRQRREQYDNQIEELKHQININQEQISVIDAELNSDRSQLDALLNADRTEEYNARVPGFNAKVGEYNRLVNITRQLVLTHNNLVDERNKIALEEQELIEKLDSTKLTPQERQ